jgi:hypothetical protein
MCQGFLFELDADTTDAQFAYAIFAILIGVLILGAIVLSIFRIICRVVKEDKPFEIKYSSFLRLPDDMKKEIISLAASSSENSGLFVEKAMLARKLDPLTYAELLSSLETSKQQVDPQKRNVMIVASQPIQST